MLYRQLAHIREGFVLPLAFELALVILRTLVDSTHLLAEKVHRFTQTPHTD